MANRKKILRNSLILVIALLVLGAGSGYGYYKYMENKLDNGLKQSSVRAVNTEPRPTDSETPSLPNDQETFLIVGSDSRYDNNGEGSPETMEGRRSDTMMLLTVSKDRKVLTGVSLPRDLMVENPPTCKTWDAETRKSTKETYNFQSPAQLNSAFNVGGPACAVLFAEKVSNLQVSRYIEIDFSGFKNIIDALGGIDITVDKPMIDNNLGVIFKEAGTHHVDGKKALDFARARQVQGDTLSDLARIERQQYLIKAIITQKLTKGTLANPGKVSSLIDSFTKNTSTDNINADFLLDLAFDLKDVGLDRINMHSLPVTDYEPDPNRLTIISDQSKWLFERMSQGKEVTDKDLSEWDKE